MNPKQFIKYSKLISRTFYSFTRMEKGKFIVLEGLDRSGKSSITKYLQA